MPAITFKPRVKETSTTTGTGNITLAGAVVGYQSFDDGFVVTDDYFYYCIEGVDGSGVPTGQWEEGIGHLSASTTLVRDTLLSSSTGSAVSFSAGTKNVFCTVAARFVNDGVVRVLSTVTMDLNASAATMVDIFTCPAGKECFITDVVIHEASATTVGALAVGWNVDGDNIVGEWYPGMVSGRMMSAWQNAQLQTDRVFGTAGDVLKHRVQDPNGSACTLKISILGYFLDA